MTDTKKPEPPKLDRDARIARALGSQGKSSLLAQGLYDSELDVLENCCSDLGVIDSTAPGIVAGIIADYYDRNKTTVDDPEVADNTEEPSELE